MAAKKRTAARADALEFNHAMIYTRKMGRALAFYRDLLGFVVVDEYPGAYVRLKSRKGRTTIALHVLDEGQRLDPGAAGSRLYFEAQDLDGLCRRLKRRGVRFQQNPKDMPWGWRHAYLRDPDGHEISLYHAGAKRLKRTVLSGGDH